MTAWTFFTVLLPNPWAFGSTRRWWPMFSLSMASSRILPGCGLM